MDQRNASKPRQRIQPADLDEIDMSVLLHYLSHLVESYEDWIKVGTALKSWDFSRGFDLWNDWSAQGSTYDPSIMRGKWKSFATGSVSFDFLIAVAFKNGWTYKRDSDQKPATPPPQADPDTMPDKSDPWRQRTTNALGWAFYNAWKAARQASNLKDWILFGYMWTRGLLFARTRAFPSIRGIEQIPVSKEKKTWSGIVAEIRDVLGELRGYHVIFLESCPTTRTPNTQDREDLERTGTTWREYRKAPIAKEDQKKTYRLPQKTVSGGGVWLYPQKPKEPYKTLVLCEGIETAIALHELYKQAWSWPDLTPNCLDLAGYRPLFGPTPSDVQFVACLSAVNMAKIVAPLGIERIHIFADVEPSRAGLKAAAQAAAQFEKSNVSCTVFLSPTASNSPDVSRDWHDEVCDILADKIGVDQ